ASRRSGSQVRSKIVSTRGQHLCTRRHSQLNHSNVMATRWSISPLALWSPRAVLIGWVIAFALVRLPFQVVEAPQPTRHVIIWLSSYLALMALQAGWSGFKRVGSARHAR